MWTEKYYVFDVDGRKAYVRKDRLSMLNRVGGVIFDCDGVLVDIRESYNKAIARTVSHVLKSLTNSEVPEGLVCDELIYLFRRTGGFNNDWDTVYGILMFTLSKMPDEKRDALKNLVTKISSNQSPFQRLSSARKAAEQAFEKNCLRKNFFEETFRSLKEFTRFLDASGTASVDKALAEMTGSNGNFEAFCSILGSFLYLPAEVGKSIIATAQEEFF
jgi:beta-phosphoglucomutase-like phosphatase (HAD superfamily)